MGAVAASPEQLARLRERPAFHISSARWLNDPNGPLYVNGHYHLFFQSLTTSAWTWGLAWGHAVSTDLITWSLLPNALNPTPGGYDADGCFSGCATVDDDGVPTILYTGVVRRPDRAWAEGASLTCSKLAMERQLLAYAADKDDPNLTTWVKHPEPLIDCPPKGMPVNCFRDPFMIERPSHSNGGYWRMMIGSAVEACAGACYSCEGAALVYRSKQLREGWEYEGMLCKAPPGCGQVWECPVIACLPTLPAQLSPGSAAKMARTASLPKQEHWHEAPTGQEAVMKPARRLQRMASAPAPAAAEAALEEFAAQQRALLLEAIGAERGSTAAPSGAEPFSAQALAAELRVAQSYTPARAFDAQAVPHARLLRPQQSCPAGFGRAAEAAAAVADESEQGTAVRGAAGGFMPAGPAIPEEDSSIGSEEQEEQQEPEQERYQYMFSASTGELPAIFWLGDYRDGRFDIEAAKGPFPLDLGDVAYAPNLLKDAYGRVIMWLWLREHPSTQLSGIKDYVGAISVPRVLHLHGAHMHQQPLPELEQLRRGEGWQAQQMRLEAGAQPVPIPLDSTHMDISLCCTPSSHSEGTQATAQPTASTSTAAGNGTGPQAPTHHHNTSAHGASAAQGSAANGTGSHSIGGSGSSGSSRGSGGGGGGGSSGSSGGNGSSGGSGGNGSVAPVAVVLLEPLEEDGQRARITYDFCSCELGIVVTDDKGVVAERRLSAHLEHLKPGEPLELRLLLDGSVLEAFLGSGEALATQVYRSAVPGCAASHSTVAGESKPGSAGLSATSHSTVAEEATPGNAGVTAKSSHSRGAAEASAGANALSRRMGAAAGSGVDPGAAEAAGQSRRPDRADGNAASTADGNATGIRSGREGAATADVGSARAAHARTAATAGTATAAAALEDDAGAPTKNWEKTAEAEAAFGGAIGPTPQADDSGVAADVDAAATGKGDAGLDDKGSVAGGGRPAAAAGSAGKAGRGCAKAPVGGVCLAAEGCGSVVWCVEAYEMSSIRKD